MRSGLLVLAAADIVRSLPQTVSEKPDNLDRRLMNGLGKTPALGWNSWNQGGCEAATAVVALNTASAFINLGLRDVGYTYINIDDCWSTTSRNSSGYLVPDPNKFPQGIKALTDQIHSMGLKFGLYGDAGTMTCAGHPGSQGYEVQDAKLLASWGVDYWKHDNCYTPCNAGLQQTCTNPAGSSQTWYIKMRDALLSSGRPIFYSLCNWGRDNVWTWGADVGNSWRMSIDNWGNWADVVRIASEAAPIASYSAAYGFNDLDMMIIGNGRLTTAEERTHFGIWAISKSPIIMGTDLTKLTTERLNLIKNRALLAINQDSLGKAATTFRPSGAASPVSGQLYPYWAGPLSDGVVVGLVAPDGAQTLSVNFADVPGLGAGTFAWTELYSGHTGSGISVSANLNAHDMAVFKVVRIASG
ncbi:Alpha-galactosidase [Venustampulla echinocandica]|uniref:Alpha-galactosidase n=1 Tax=Venustampulla echinocandica TaxID=2656787 RepID=A0A370T9X6_9HELO|nr:Alpha-galactosidase [Venustampulla echinocandica]RDL30464.1 Alpha-galactosidase [Venustampulla echinocandica]